MAAKTSPYLDFLLREAFSEICGITYRRMFGGYGLYKNGIFFGIIAYDTLYFKVDEKTKPSYVELGSVPFVYEGKSKPVEMSYWEVPDSVLSDSSLLSKWVQEACKAYVRAKKK